VNDPAATRLHRTTARMISTRIITTCTISTRTTLAPMTATGSTEQ